MGRINDMERDQGLVDQPGLLQQVDHRESADQRRGEEGQNDGHQQQLAAARRLQRHGVSHGIAERQAKQRGGRGDADRIPQGDGVEIVAEDRAVIVEIQRAPFKRVAVGRDAVERMGEADRQRDHKRRQEKGEEPRVGQRGGWKGFAAGCHARRTATASDGQDSVTSSLMWKARAA